MKKKEKGEKKETNDLGFDLVCADRACVGARARARVCVYTYVCMYVCMYTHAYILLNNDRI